MSRPKGTPNKIGARVKDNIVSVFDRLGGVEKMVEWAMVNQTEFYRLYAKLMPTEMTVAVDEDSIEQYVNSLTDDEFRQFAEGIKRIVISASGAEAAIEAGTTERPDKVH